MVASRKPWTPRAFAGRLASQRVPIVAGNFWQSFEKVTNDLRFRASLVEPSPDVAIAKPPARVADRVSNVKSYHWRQKHNVRPTVPERKLKHEHAAVFIKAIGIRDHILSRGTWANICLESLSCANARACYVLAGDFRFSLSAGAAGKNRTYDPTLTKGIP